MLALAVSSAALADSAIVDANDYFMTEIGDFWGEGPIVQGSDVTFDWTSNQPLTLVITGPSGIVESYSASNHGSDTISIDETGTYYMTWTNSGSTPASLTYNVQVDMFAPIHDTFDTVLLGIVLGVVAVVVVIILVVVLVIRGDRPKKAVQMGQPMAPVAPSATVCPNCGSPIDSTVQWCARCGAKLR